MDVTNKLVVNYHEKHGIVNTVKWLHSQFSDQCTDGALTASIKRLVQKTRKLSKSTKPIEKRKKEQFLNENYKVPKSKSSIRESQKSHSKEATYENEIAQLQKQNPRSNIFQQSKDTIEIQTLKEEVEKHKSTTEKLRLDTQFYKGKCDIKTAELKRLRQREQYYREKAAALEKYLQNEDEEGTQDNTNKDHMQEPSKEDELQRQNIELEYRLSLLQDELEEKNNGTLECYDEVSGKYTPAFQNCVHRLLDNNIPANRVVPCMNAVFDYAGTKPNRMPCTSTINTMNLQRLPIAQKQLEEELRSAANTTLETDEASKYGKKYGAYAIRTEEGRGFVLGLRDLLTKSGQDTLQTLKEILWDIDKLYFDSAEESGAPTISDNILYHLRNTMSDRAATEMKFNELLELYRAEILPKVEKNWDDLTPQLQGEMTRLNNFFCGLHGLVHMAETANTATKEAEKNHYDGPCPIYNPSFRKNSESGVCRLVRTSCQAFAYGGDAKNGCHGRFDVFIKEFLKENGFQSLPLTPYRGNRFNILFHNAGVIYWLRNHMLAFLKVDESNAWVRHDLDEAFYVAGARALGLVSKLVTTPLWSVVEDKNIHINDMNTKYLQLLNYLQDATKNTEAFMSGELGPVFPSVPVKEDAIYRALIEPSESDGDCCIILGVLLPSLAKVVSHLYKDHLPGGIHEVTPPSRQATKSVPKHNKYCETVFGYFDQILKTRPHTSTIAAEACIMFSFNKTHEWLNQKSTEEMNHILKESYKEVGKIRERFKERQRVMKEEKNKQLKEKRAKLAEAKRKKVMARTAITNDILYWGLMQSTEHVDNLVMDKRLKQGEKMEALKVQVKFRRDILGQEPSDPKLFNFSKQTDDKKRKTFSVEELGENIKTLIYEATERNIPQDEQATAADGNQFVKQRIEHCFEVDGERKWYTGTVLSQLPGFPTYFNVKYDSGDGTRNGLGEAVYNLLEDYRSGDLKIAN